MQERVAHWSFSGLRARIGRASAKASSARRRDGYEGRGRRWAPPQTFGLPREGSGLHLGSPPRGRCMGLPEPWALPQAWLWRPKRSRRGR